MDVNPQENEVLKKSISQLYKLNFLEIKGVDNYVKGCIQLLTQSGNLTPEEEKEFKTLLIKGLERFHLENRQIIREIYDYIYRIEK